MSYRLTGIPFTEEDRKCLSCKKRISKWDDKRKKYCCSICRDKASAKRRNWNKEAGIPDDPDLYPDDFGREGQLDAWADSRESSNPFD